MRITSENLPQTMKYLRTRLGLTKTELSQLSGVSIPAIIRYENGERSPNLTTLWSLLAVLKADIEITY